MEMEFSGKTWKNIKEAVQQIHTKVTALIRTGDLKNGDIFNYPELSQELMENHFYLRMKHMKPEHFKIEIEDGHSNHNKIYFYLPKIASSNKYRILDMYIQKNYNFTYRRSQIIQAFHEEFDKISQEWIQKTNVCEKCLEEKKKYDLTIFIPEFHLENIVQNYIRNSTKKIVETAIYYDFEKGDRIQLNYSNAMVKRLLYELKSYKHQILCKKCNKEMEIDYLWKILLNPNSPSNQIRKILKKIAKSGSKEEVEQLHNLIQGGLTARLRNISPEVRHILSEFHYVVKDFIRKREFYHLIKQWSEILSIEGYISTRLGHSLLVTLYRIDEEEFNEIWMKNLFNSQENLFTFFRVVARFPLNSKLKNYLQEKNISSNEEEDAKRRVLILQALIHSRESVIQEIVDEYFQYSFESQKNILQFLSEQNDFKWYNTLKKKILQDEKANLLEMEPIVSIFHEFEEKIQNIEKFLKQEKIKEESLLNSEIEKSTQLFFEWRKKKGPSPFKMHQIKNDLLHKYRKIIGDHILDYQDEFVQYFKTHDQGIVAFDVEEIHFQMFCVLAVEIKPDLTYFVKLLAVDDIYPIKRYSSSLTSNFRRWLESIEYPDILSHGTNQEELELIVDSGHHQINTQDILHNLNYLNSKYSLELNGEGLKHFEDYLNFKRKACCFFKHGISGPVFFQQAPVSLDHHLTKTSQETCLICEKEQDVLLYCLEDAFSCMLIYVYFQNHEPELWKSTQYI